MSFIYVYDAMWCGVTLRDVTWRNVTRRDVTWCDVMWCDVMWCDVTWRDVTWCVVMWCDVIWCDVCDVMWYDVIWPDVIRCDLTWRDVTWCDVTSGVCCDIIMMWCEDFVYTTPQYSNLFLRMVWSPCGAYGIWTIFLHSWNTVNNELRYKHEKKLQCISW